MAKKTKTFKMEKKIHCKAFHDASVIPKTGPIRGFVLAPYTQVGNETKIKTNMLIHSRLVTMFSSYPPPPVTDIKLSL